MKIGNDIVPKKIILRYCKIIKILENEYSDIAEHARSQLHDRILVCAGHHRGLYTREARIFDKALNNVILDLIEY